MSPVGWNMASRDGDSPTRGYHFARLDSGSSPEHNRRSDQGRDAMTVVQPFRRLPAILFKEFAPEHRCPERQVTKYGAALPT